MSLWIVSRETSERLGLLEDLLQRWNDRINLVGPREIPHLKTRHIDDSLQLVPLLPSQGRLVDLGSGAGFPGLVIAIATDRPVVLIEADTRKASFLREAARLTGASAEVVDKRIEDCRTIRAEIITARALAPLDRLLSLAHPLLEPGGTCFFLKGGRIEAELTAARARWQMSMKRHPSCTMPDGWILEVRHLQPVQSIRGAG